MSFFEGKRMRVSFFVVLTSLVLTQAALAEDPLRVIVNQSVPVDRVDAAQATQIFLKQIRTWSDGTAIEPIDLQEDSPVRDEFYRQVTGREPAQLRAYWARQAFTGMGFPPRRAADAAEAARLVKDTPGAIGYTAIEDVDGSLKVVLEPRQ
jgi:ABC-type phosphate transport system substrate-binding protein